MAATLVLNRAQFTDDRLSARILDALRRYGRVTVKGAPRAFHVELHGASDGFLFLDEAEAPFGVLRTIDPTALAAVDGLLSA